MLVYLLEIIISLITPLNIIFACIIVFNERRNPASTWAWLMLVALFPVVGFIAYLILGQDSRKNRVFAQKARDDEQVFDEFLVMADATNAFWSTQKSYISEKNVMHMPDTEHLNDLVYLNFFAGSGPFTVNNQLTLYHDGRSKMEMMMEDIASARSFIFIQYYIFRDDEMGRHVIRQLAKKALEGVEVRLLVDRMGCFFNSKQLYKPLLDAGGHLGLFMPPALIRMNYRNHRKLTVIDGEIGYIGGLNIGNEYMGMTKRFGYWRDTHIRLTGDAIQPLTLRFVMDWNFTVKKKLPLNYHYFPKAAAPDINGVRMQIVSSGPDTRYPSVLYGYCKMITEADKSIYIQTPYFVPDESLYGALRVAALSGIDVRIMIPANPDHPFVYWAALSYLGDLLEVGVKCYEYEKGFIHSKVIMIDSLICSVGTANMDVRSFKLNFECNAFIYDADTTRQLEAEFMKDLLDCHPIEIDTYKQRGRITKIKESLSRLISPLL